MLNNLEIINAQVGNSQVKEIWKGSNRIWPIDFNAFWVFNTSSSGKTVSNFKVVYNTGTLQVNWGDQTVQDLGSNVNTNHTYT